MTERADFSRSEAETLAEASDGLQRETESRTEQDADQTAADLDQTQAESDHGLSESDQFMSDSDQVLADRDQHASDRDQAAADWERVHSPDAARAGDAYEAHEQSRVERDASSRERDSTAADRSRTTAHRLSTAARRDEIARVRDITAAARDRIADARDTAADTRDRAAKAREQRALEAGTLEDVIAPLRELRRSGAAIRKQAATERRAAEVDRASAAADRQQAAADRRYAGLDDLTGIFRRGTGELALTHEIDRSRRSGQSLVLTIIDVDGLKAVNDSEGHATGDSLLRDVATAIISTMRSYDVTVRWGGDEFVCALSDVTLEVASDRIAQIQRALEERRPGASISAGLAELAPEDNLEPLIARADTALYKAKTDRRDR